MPEAAKVLPLDPLLNTRQRANLGKLPAPLAAMHQKYRIVVQTLLDAFADTTIDALFQSADNANHIEEQQQLFNALRHFRNQQHHLSHQLLSGIDAAFAALLDNTPVQQTATSNDDAMAWLIPLEAAINDNLAANTNTLASLNTRIIHIAARKTPCDNPVSADTLGKLFAAQVTRLQLPIKATNALVTTFIHGVMAHLPSIYTALENILDQHGIPRAKELDAHFASQHISQLSKRPKPATTAQPNAKLKPNTQTTAILECVLGASSNTKQLSRKELMNVLNVAQREMGEATTHTTNTPIHQLLQLTQKRLNLSGSLASYDSELIKLVGVMFELVTRNQNLDSIVKGYLNRLLVPTIKVALLDKSFFARSNHPTRCLLNELVTCGLGWQQDQDKNQQEPGIRIINTLTRHIAESFDNDAVIFDQGLNKLRDTQRQEEKQLSLLSARLSSSSVGRTQANNAEDAALGAVAECIALPNIAPVTQIFAQQLWSKVLTITAFKYGTSSTQWQESIKLLKQIHTLTTPSTNTADKIQRSQQLPKLMPKIQQHLAMCAHNAFDTAEILEALHATLCQCLKGQPAPAFTLKNTHIKEAPTPGSVEVASNTEVNPSTASQTTAAMAGPQTNKRIQAKIKPNVKTTEHSATPTPPASASELSADDMALKQQIEQFARGALFDWNEATGSTIRCRLAAVIRQTNRYIFINRNGIKVVEMSINEMIQAIKDRQLKPIEHGMVFDKALEEVVTGLRRPQNDSIGDRA